MLTPPSICLPLNADAYRSRQRLTPHLPSNGFASDGEKTFFLLFPSNIWSHWSVYTRSTLHLGYAFMQIRPTICRNKLLVKPKPRALGAPSFWRDSNFEKSFIPHSMVSPTNCEDSFLVFTSSIPPSDVSFSFKRWRIWWQIRNSVTNKGYERHLGDKYFRPKLVKETASKRQVLQQQQQQQQQQL